MIWMDYDLGGNSQATEKNTGKKENHIERKKKKEGAFYG